MLLNTEDHLYSYDELKAFVSANIQEEDFLVQPYINCRTKMEAHLTSGFTFKKTVMGNGSLPLSIQESAHRERLSQTLTVGFDELSRSF